MTDTFGSEPQEQASGHDEILTPEQEIVHEAPSEDEFADHHDDDHVAAVSEEHSDDMGALPIEEPARRSPLLPIAAAVGGVLLLGIVAWWQFSGPSSAPPPTGEVGTMAPIPVAPVAATSPAASNVVPMSTIAPKTAAAPAAAASSIAIPQAPVAASTAVSGGYAPAVQQQATPPSNAVEDQRITALTARIDNLQRALDQANQQLGQVTNMVAATAPIPACHQTTRNCKTRSIVSSKKLPR